MAGRAKSEVFLKLFTFNIALHQPLKSFFYIEKYIIGFVFKFGFVDIFNFTGFI
jgi:hypothetical protein